MNYEHIPPNSAHHRQNKEHKLEETFGSANAGRGARYSRRQLFPNAAIAASRAASQPCVGEQPSWTLESNRLEHLGEIEFEFFLSTQPERIP
jgi:hypothetical protein